MRHDQSMFVDKAFYLYIPGLDGMCLQSREQFSNLCSELRSISVYHQKAEKQINSNTLLFNDFKKE